MAISYTFHKGPDTGGGHIPALCVHPTNVGWAGLGGDIFGPHTTTTAGGALGGDGWQARLGGTTNNGQIYARAQAFSLKTSGMMYCGIGTLSGGVGIGRFASVSINDWRFTTISTTFGFGTSLQGTRPGDFHPRAAGNLISVDFDGTNEYVYFVSGTKLIRFNAQTSTFTTLNDFGATLVPNGAWAALGFDPVNLVLYPVTYASTGNPLWDLTSNLWSVQGQGGKTLRTATGATDLNITRITTAPAVVNEINYFGGALYAAAGTDASSSVYSVTNTGTTWTPIGSLNAGTSSAASSVDGTSPTNIYVGLAYAGTAATPTGQGVAHWNGTSWSWIVPSAAVSVAEWGTTERGLTNRTFWLSGRSGLPGHSGYDVEMLRVQHNPATGKDIVYVIGQNPFVSVDSGATWRPATLGMNGGECNTGLNLSNTTSGTVNWGNFDFGTVQSTDNMATVTSRPNTTQGATVPTVENHPTGWALAFGNGAWDLTTPNGSIANDYFRATMCDPQAWTVDQTNDFVYITQFTGATLYGFPSTLQALQAPVLAPPTVTANTIASSWTAAIGGTSPYTYQVSFDGGAFRTPSSGASGLTDTSTLAAGSHTLIVKVTDSATNTALSNLVTFTSNPVNAPTITAPVANSTLTLPNVVSTWTAPTGGSTPYTYQISYDGAAFQAANGTGGLSDTKTLTNGTHTIQVKVTDSTNATATSNTVSFTVNALTAGAITAPTPNQSFSVGTVISSWNAATGGTAPYTYKIQYDSSPFRAPSSASTFPLVPNDTTRYLGIEANPRNGRTDTQELAYVNSQIAPDSYQIIRRYHGWDRDLIDSYEAGIAAPQIISPYWYITNANNTFTTYLAILNGSQDAVIDRNAAAVKAYGRPMFLTWQMEPENDIATAGTAANFILAYQRVVNRFRAAGVTNVSWVWVLMDSTYSAGTQDQWYPGDAYVDWIGVDGYNWFDQGGHSAPWKSFQTIFQTYLNYVTSKGKPGFIGEMATVPDPLTPGRKAAWYDDMMTTLATTPWNPIKAVSYFNSQPFGGSPNWWLDDDATGVSPNATDVTHWQAAAGSPTWNVTAATGLSDTTVLSGGTHTIRIQVTDSVGTVATTPAVTFQVGPLAMGAITSPVNNQTVASAVVTITWNSATGGTPPYEYLMSVDNGSFSTAEVSGTTATHTFTNGPHTVQIKVIDNVGATTGAALVSFTETASLTAPIITAPPNPITTASFVTSWTASTGGAGGITYQINYGAGYVTPTSGPTGLSDNHTFTDGTYTVRVQATDTNGLTIVSTPVNYVVQSTPPPTPTIDSGPTVSSGGTTSSTTATFGFHETGNINPVVFTGQITGGAALPVTSPVTYSALAAGSYTFTLSARDTVTNLVSGTATWAWTVSSLGVPVTPVITSGPSLGGASASQTVTIKNTGTANLTIGTLTLTGANAGQFVISTDNASGKTVAPGASVTVVLIFQPASAGSYTANLNIPNNANTTDTLLLTGSAVATGTTAASVTPLSVAFGSVLFGTTSAATTLSVKNIGTLAITLGTTTISGSTSFALQNDLISGASVPPNQTATAQVVYTPASGSEVATGDVLIHYDSTNSTGNLLDVPLTGSGRAPVPAVNLSSSTLNFPVTNVSVTSSALVLTVRNVGTANLICGTATITGTNASNFAKTSDNVSGQTIAPNAAATIGVTFTPSASGSRAGILNIFDNATGSPQQVVLSGTGSAPLPIASLTPAILSFGTVNMFATSSPQTLTITNTGTSNLVVSQVTLTGTNPLQFAIQTDNASGQTITPGGNRTVVVVFKPKRIGSLSASVSVTDNAGGSPQAIPLGGAGVVASVQPLAKTVYAYYYPNYGLSPTEGFGSETYQGWGGTVPAPAGTAVTHTFAPPTSIASDYYPGDYWSGAAGYPPAIYSSSDPIALQAQCVAAITAGVNVLIVSWKPPPDRSDTLIPALLAAAQAATNVTGLPLFLSFMIEPYATCDFIDPTDSTHVTGGRAVTNVWRAINYINSTYGAHSNFYRTARAGWHYAGRGLGANLFFVNHPEYDYLVSGSPHATIAASGTSWQTTTDDVHNPALVPLGGLVLAESSYAPNYVNGQHFDGGFAYLSLPLTQAGLFNESVFQFLRTYELGFPPTAICIPGVAPGYSGWRTQDTLDRRFLRNSGGFYDTQWYQALNGVGLDDIAITSWNDWQHGTQIEPATNQTTGTGL